MPGGCVHEAFYQNTAGVVVLGSGVEPGRPAPPLRDPENWRGLMLRFEGFFVL